MAMTWRRTLLGMLLTCLALTAVLLPPRGSRRILTFMPWSWYLNGYLWSAPVKPDSLVIETNRLAQAVREAGAEWLVLRWRDSIAAQPAIASAARGKDPVVLVRARVEPRRLQALRYIMAQAWRRLPRHDPESWTMVVVIPDTLPGRIGESGVAGPFNRYVLFAPLIEGHGCVLLVSASAVNTWPQDVVDDLAWCGWRAAFGPPAQAVNGWLRRANWAPGDLATWAPGTTRSGWASRLTMMFEEDAEGARGSREHYAQRLMVQAGIEGRLGLAGCLAGRAEACLRLMSEPSRRGIRLSLDGVRQGQPIGVVEATVRAGLLAALLDQFGVERFQRFWTSGRPIDAAFEDLSGVSQGEWVRALVQRRIGIVRPGGEVRALPAMLSLMAGFLLVGLATRFAMRREVG